MVAVTPHLDDEMGGQGVDDRGTDAVQTAGDLVAPVAELAAGVQLGQHQGDGRDVLDGVLLDRDTTSVVGDLAPVVVEQLDLNGVAVTGHCLVDRVVDDLVDAVVQTALTGGTDVHTGTLPDGFQTFQDSDLTGVIGSIDGRRGKIRVKDVRMIGGVDEKVLGGVPVGHGLGHLGLAHGQCAPVSLQRSR